MTEAEIQALACQQVELMVTALRGAGWDFACVSIWRRGADGSFAGASFFDIPRALTQALPVVADNLRTLAGEMDEAHRASGCTERAHGWTQVLSGTTVDARRERGGAG